MVLTHSKNNAAQPTGYATRPTEPHREPVQQARVPSHRMMQSIENLKTAVEQETNILLSGETIDLADYNVRKNHGLVELTRAMRSLTDRSPPDEVLENLRDLRQSLARNEGVLKLHLDAVREVSEVMTKAISDSESDGTYTASIQNMAKHYG